MKIIGADTLEFLSRSENSYLTEYFEEVDKDFTEIKVDDNYVTLTQREIEDEVITFLVFYIVEVPDNLEPEAVPNILEDHFDQLSECNILIQFSSCLPAQIDALIEEPSKINRENLFITLFEGE